LYKLLHRPGGRRPTASWPNWNRSRTHRRRAAGPSARLRRRASNNTGSPPRPGFRP